MDGSKKSILMNKLLNDELLDYEIYKKLTTMEKDKSLKASLGKLAKMEKAHLEIWRGFAGAKMAKETTPLIVLLKGYLFVLARRIIGVAFVTMLLSRNELKALKKYTKAVSVGGLSAYERKRLNLIIQDELFLVLWNRHEELAFPKTRNDPAPYGHFCHEDTSKSQPRSSSSLLCRVSRWRAPLLGILRASQPPSALC